MDLTNQETNNQDNEADDQEQVSADSNDANPKKSIADSILC